MWLLTTFGFFSVVQKRGTRYLTVRARVGADLDQLRERYLPALTATQATPANDYAYRATISRAKLASAMGKIVRDITYDNFKSEVAHAQGLPRERVYAKVWTVLHTGLPPLDEPPAARDGTAAAGGVPTPARSPAPPGPEIVVEVGAEGGSLTLFRQPTPSGGFEFFTSLNAMGYEEVAGIHATSARTATAEEGLRLLDAAPGCEWHRLWPVEIHPAYAARVLAAVEARFASAGGEDDSALARWRRVCGGAPT